jgi:hypothetical protein
MSMTRRVIALCLLLVLVAPSMLLIQTNLVSPNVEAQTQVNGIITQDTTWTKTNSPYTFSGNVLVNKGVTLTVQSGVTVNLDGYYLMVNGTLMLKGNSTDKVNVNGGSINFTPFSSPWNSQSDSGCLIENAIIDQTPISSSNSLKVTGTTLNGEVTAGASSLFANDVIAARNYDSSTISIPYAVTAGSSSVISNNVIYGTHVHGQAWAAVIDYYSAINTNSSTISQNNITGNIAGNSLTINNNTIAGGISTSYSVITHNTINGDVYGSSIAVSNNIIAGGRPTYDWGGRTDDPTSAIMVAETSTITSNTISSPTGGYGITIQQGTTSVSGNTITNCLTGIRVAGKSTIENNRVTNNNQGIRVGEIIFSGFNYYDWGSGDSIIRNNVIADNSVGIGSTNAGGSATIERNLIFKNTYGISVASQVLLLNNTITNSSQGIRIKATAATINFNNIQNNGQYTIYLDTTTNNIDATYNWWGTTDPQAISQKIYDYNDDFNLGTVTFSPFLTTENPAAPTQDYTPSSTPVPTPTPTTSTSTPNVTPQTPVAIGNLFGLNWEQTVLIIMAVVIAALAIVMVVLLRNRSAANRRGHPDWHGF